MCHRRSCEIALRVGGCGRFKSRIASKVTRIADPGRTWPLERYGLVDADMIYSNFRPFEGSNDSYILN